MTASEPLITTILPTYRRPERLRRAIQSVLAQTEPCFRVRVYDNASGDETSSVVAQLAGRDDRIRYHCHAENIGAIRNIVCGLEHVDTPFFSILSDDDVLLPEFYQEALKGFETYPAARLSATGTIHINEEGLIRDVRLRGWEAGLYLPPRGLLAMLENLHPEWTSVLMRREVLEEVGGLDPDVGAIADLDLELRISARFPIVVSPKPGALFLEHAPSYSSKRHLDVAGWLKMIRNLSEDERIAPHARNLADHLLRRRLKNLVLGHGLGSIARTNWDDADRSADLLDGHFRLRGMASLLRGTAGFCKAFPPALHFLRLAKAVNRAISRRRRVQLQRDFGVYKLFLEPIGAPWATQGLRSAPAVSVLASRHRRESPRKGKEASMNQEAVEQ